MPGKSTDKLYDLVRKIKTDTKIKILSRHGTEDLLVIADKRLVNKLENAIKNSRTPDMNFENIEDIEEVEIIVRAKYNLL